MKSKRLIAITIAALMSIAITSCGGSSNEEKPEESTLAATQPESGESSEAATETETASTTEPTEKIEPPADAKPLGDIISGIPASDVKSATLTEIGKIDDKEIRNYHNFLYKSITNNNIQCVDYMGNLLFDGNVDHISRLVNDNPYDTSVFPERHIDLDLYVYYLVADGDFKYCGLMDKEGNVILDANEKAGAFEAINERFIKVYFPEALTEDLNEILFKADIDTFTIMTYNNTAKYSGTVKVYDLQQRKFLENTARKTDTEYSVSDNIVTFNDDDYKLIAVTTDDKIIELEPQEDIAGDFIVKYANGVTPVLDKDRNKLFSTNYGVEKMSGTNEYYRIYDSDIGKRGLMHKSGTVIIEPKFGNIMYLNDGMFSYCNDQSSKNGLLSIDGTVLTDAVYNELTYTGIPGLFCGNENYKYDLIDEKGNIIINDAQMSFKEDFYFYHEGDVYNYLVISKPDKPLEFKSMGIYMGNHLILNKDEMAIYDLVTGEKVLEGFDNAYTAYDNIYTVKDDEITIYRAETSAE